MTAPIQETTYVDAVDVYGCIGRLEGEVSNMSEAVRRVERKLDRLSLVMFGGGALFVIAEIAILVKLFLG